MGIWVVMLEAVRGPDDSSEEIGPDDLDAFAEELADYYPVVAGSPTSYEAELWVEENTAGGAMLVAQRIWQGAVRGAGLPMWDVLRGEARDARALESGRLAWATAPGDQVASDEPEPDPEPEPAPPKRAAARKAPAKKAPVKKGQEKTKKVGARTRGAATKSSAKKDGRRAP